MSYNRIVISSGHGLYVRGAADILDEVDCARELVELLADELRHRGIDVVTFHDDVSKSQSENLDRIVDFHNAQPPHDLDISCHFNAFEHTTKPMGTEVLWLTQHDLAAQLSQAIANVGFINRGAKKRTDLAFLNNTSAPSVLLEVCFVDSTVDADVYKKQTKHVAQNIADILAGGSGSWHPPGEVVKPPPATALFYAKGKCSIFGGPADTGVDEDEGLAFIYDITPSTQHLFLPIDSGTELARRLNPYVHYVACRWDYNKTPKTMLANSGQVALVRATKTGIALTAFPSDWGPHSDTKRVADLSPSLLADLGIETDDEVEVTYPWTED